MFIGYGRAGVGVGFGRGGVWGRVVVGVGWVG